MKTSEASDADRPAARRSVAIVSSCDRMCGIAAYTKSLAVSLSRDFRVDVLELDVDLLRDRSATGIRAGDRHIEEVARRARAYDVVNLHLEHGLFGIARRDIDRRIAVILDAAKAVILTVHWVVPEVGTPWRRALRALSRLDLRAAEDIVNRHLDERMLGSGLFGRLRRLQASKPVSIVVHNAYDRRVLEEIHGLARVHDHPLAFLSQEEMADALASRVAMRKQLAADWGDDRTEIVGVFGFYSPYKGFETAIRAMSLLPEDTHLLICGGVHPNAGTPESATAPYARRLLDEVAALGPAGRRVHFTGQLDDDAFTRAIAAVDRCVFAYHENGLSSSGPIAIAVELGSRIAATTTRAFREFARYHPGRIEFFEPGDHEALAALIGRSTPKTGDRPSMGTATNAALYAEVIAECS